MNSALKYDKGTQWLIAIAISVALHVGLLVLLAIWHAAGSPSDRADIVPPEPAESVSSASESGPATPEESAKPDPKPARAEPVPAPRAEEPAPPKPAVSKPVVAPKPVAPVRDVFTTVGEKPEKAGAEADTHVVKKGETLSSIAKSCGCTLAELVKLNGASLKKLSNLRVGQKLKVPRANGPVP